MGRIHETGEAAPALKPASGPAGVCGRCRRPLFGDEPSLPLGLGSPAELAGTFHRGCARIRERELAEGRRPWQLSTDRRG